VTAQLGDSGPDASYLLKLESEPLRGLDVFFSREPRIDENSFSVDLDDLSISWTYQRR
jgi:hypothetical protein